MNKRYKESHSNEILSCHTAFFNRLNDYICHAYFYDTHPYREEEIYERLQSDLKRVYGLGVRYA